LLIDATRKELLELAVERTEMTFPERVLIQKGFLPEVYEEFERRSIPVVELVAPTDHVFYKSYLRDELTEKQLSNKDLIVAIPSGVEVGLQLLGIDITAPDYPSCLQHLFHRAIWETTLGDAVDIVSDGHRFFIKPVEDAKSFNGFVAQGPVDAMLNILLDREIFPGLSSNTKVWMSEVVDMSAGEYAVYVVDGVIRSVCHYMCKRSTCRCESGELDLPTVELDMDVVQNAIEVLYENEPRLTGYRADFALVKDGDSFATALVEVNDGYVAGRYDGISVADYTDMIVSRFRSLQAIV